MDATTGIRDALLKNFGWEVVAPGEKVTLTMGNDTYTELPERIQDSLRRYKTLENKSYWARRSIRRIFFSTGSALFFGAIFHQAQGELKWEKISEAALTYNFFGMATIGLVLHEILVRILDTKIKNKIDLEKAGIAEKIKGQLPALREKLLEGEVGQSESTPTLRKWEQKKKPSECSSRKAFEGWAIPAGGKNCECCNGLVTAQIKNAF